MKARFTVRLDIPHMLARLFVTDLAGGLRVDAEFALTANRLPLTCSAGVRFLSGLKAGVSTEASDDTRAPPRFQQPGKAIRSLPIPPLTGEVPADPGHRPGGPGR
ncbi:hypothetical protein Acsp01_85680 [Actinoplanes sp. NBRC 101535]|nr:hypothetical protein Acsp01_85680 [Actinoplanes sp. NBRC 101535]